MFTPVWQQILFTYFCVMLISLCSLLIPLLIPFDGITKVLLHFSFIKPFIIIYHFFYKSLYKRKKIYFLSHITKLPQIDPQDGVCTLNFGYIYRLGLTPKNIRDNPKKCVKLQPSKNIQILHIHLKEEA